MKGWGKDDRGGKKKALQGDRTVLQIKQVFGRNHEKKKKTTREEKAKAVNKSSRKSTSEEGKIRQGGERFRGKVAKILTMVYLKRSKQSSEM